MSEITGSSHTNISQTMDTYSHVLPNMQEEAVSALEKGPVLSGLQCGCSKSSTIGDTNSCFPIKPSAKRVVF
jgi:hypothetical protein